MNLTCKRCGAEITADNINLDRMIAKCSSCNAVLSFADEFPYAATRELAYQKFNVARPKNMQVEDLGTELKITRNWSRPRAIFMFFFALFWNGFLWPLFCMLLLSREWVPVCFLIPFLAVGLGIAYLASALLLNVTEIKVNYRDLTIRHGPLPLGKNKNLLASDIKQIFCRQNISHDFEGDTNITYGLHAVTTASAREPLLTGLPEAEEALFLEQEIERFLGIKDRPVAGEFRR
jgi:hypothetical protein